MWIVQVALKRPYTFVVLALLIALFGLRSAFLTPTDIFPNINIPVISVVWTYTGLLPNDMSGRVIYYYERTLTAQVGDIEHIESQSLDGYGVVKIFFQKNVDIAAAMAQVTAASQTVLERAHPAARAVEQEIARDAAVRFGPELHPSAARHSRGRGGALALRR
jgi:multidrug efflux pump subunit AcrB